MMTEKVRGLRAVRAGAEVRALANGVDGLSDGELVAALLGVEIAMAEHLVEEKMGLMGLGRAGVGEVMFDYALDSLQAARLAAAFELARRLAREKSSVDAAPLADSHAVAAWAKPRLGDLEHEELWVLAVDGRNHVRAARRVAMGGIHGMHVSVRDVLRMALREGASAFVLVHNHPSGDPSPSAEDVAFTKRIAAAATMVGVPLLDHVVVAREGHASLLARGEL